MKTGAALLALLAVALAVLVAPGSGSAASPFDELRIGKKALEFLHQQMQPGGDVRRQLGHFYYAANAETRKAAWAWSGSGAWPAYAACQRAATRADLDVPCLALVADGVVVARSYDEARSRAGDDAWERTMWNDPLRCGQEPGSRFYWLEHGYCDVNHHGSERALGVIIWNHGIAGTMVQHAAPPAMALRLAQARGWDVIKINRHHLGEDARSYERGEERTLQEVQAQRARGYRKIVVAGQSFGGRVALEIGTRAENVFALVAMAPGMETTVGNSRNQAPTDERLRRSKVERLAVVFPGGDALFGNVQRGRSAAPILTARGRPWLMFDETAGLAGHGGGAGGNFALRYGLCLAEFLSAAHVPEGRFECPPASDWSVAKQFLPAVPPSVRVVSAGDRVPAPVARSAGRWYGVLGETIVSWALVEADGGELNAVYTWATANSRGGGVYAARVEGHGVRTTLPNQATLTVAPTAAGSLDMTLAPAIGPSNFSIYAGSNEPLRGELRPVPE